MGAGGSRDCVPKHRRRRRRRFGAVPQTIGLNHGRQQPALSPRNTGASASMRTAICKSPATSDLRRSDGGGDGRSIMQIFNIAKELCAPMYVARCPVIIPPAEAAIMIEQAVLYIDLLAGLTETAAAADAEAFDKYTSMHGAIKHIDEMLKCFILWVHHDVFVGEPDARGRGSAVVSLRK